MKKYLYLFILFYFVGCTDSIAQLTTSQLLKKPISTNKYTEYSPTISGDGKLMVFQSDRKYGKESRYRLFQCIRNEDGSWGNPLAIDNLNNFGTNPTNLGSPCLNNSGDTLYFIADYAGAEGGRDIYYSVKTTNNQWGDPVNLNIPINSAAYEGSPSISADGKRLYFTRQDTLTYATTNINKVGNRGNYTSKNGKEAYYVSEDARGRLVPVLDVLCFSVYMSEKDKDGIWQEPVKLPIPVNVDCEKAVRIMPDNVTLFFSSVRKEGKGNYDIYKAVMDVRGNWQESVAIRSINSPASEQFVAIPNNEEEAFFTKQYKTNDIFRISPLPEEMRLQHYTVVSGNVIDSLTRKPVIATVSVLLNDETQDVILSTLTEITEGLFNLKLRQGNLFLLKVTANGYHPKTVPVDVSQVLLKNNDFMLDDRIILSPVITNHTVVLNILNQETKTKVNSLITIYNVSKGKTEVENGGTKEGVYIASLAPNDLYRVEVKAESYAAYKGYINAEKLKKDKTHQEDIFLAEIKVITKEEIKKELNELANQVNFGSGSAVLTRDSEEELDKVVELLQEYTEVRVEVSAHTDNVGYPDANLALSQQRAKAVMNYLVRNGVDKKQ